MFYVVPLNEHNGIKELRISSSPWTFWIHGPKSGVIVEGEPIEGFMFSTPEVAWGVVREFAPHLLP